LQKQILKFNEEGRLLAAICAAPMVLGKMGILEGEQAVCYRVMRISERSLYSFRTATESNHVITGRGVGAALKFLAMIVEKLFRKKKPKLWPSKCWSIKVNQN
jgi:4-methyl-5(b-hydroxyethyl)-thiazole monophosphate biosynthesis